jgi:hypothetical protein
MIPILNIQRSPVARGRRREVFPWLLAAAGWGAFLLLLLCN